MKIVVTGGAGFIGSHISDLFLSKGHQILVIDNLSSGSLDNVDPRVGFHQLDVRSKEAAELIVREKPQAIAHLAAQMDVRRSVTDPGFDADVNIKGFLNVLEAAVQAGTKRVVFSSTGGAIYGEQEVFPATESHAQRPCSPYGVSKAAGELYLGYYQQQYGLSFAALRYANVYGPRQNPHGEAGVVAIFCDRILRGLDCTIFGDGKQTRDFVSVMDVARANLLALESNYVGAINIGTGLETDLNRLYVLLAQAAKLDKPPAYAAAKPGEQRRSCVDPTLAGKLFGWKAEVPLASGLQRTFDFFAERSKKALR